MFLLSFSSPKFTEIVKGSYVREELFEPLNAILLPNTTIAYIPFIAGWISSEPGQKVELQRIEVWAIGGEEMRYVSTKCHKCTEIFPPGDKSCDILNYYGCHEDQPVRRFPNKLINGVHFVKNKSSSYSGSECSGLSGPDGWCIIAHPGGSTSWKIFPQTAEKWEKLWGQHRCPLIIRSFDDDDSTNNGYGFMGIELISGG